MAALTRRCVAESALNHCLLFGGSITPKTLCRKMHGETVQSESIRSCVSDSMLLSNTQCKMHVVQCHCIHGTAIQAVLAVANNAKHVCAAHNDTVLYTRPRVSVALLYIAKKVM